jgi:uncharacterized protein (DUF58 family)
MNRRWYLLGLALIAASIPFQQHLLMVIGLLVLVVLAATDIWSTYCLHFLHYRRQFSEQRALFGEEVTLSIAVENAKLLPLPWLEIEDTLPRALTLSGQRLRVNLIGDTAVLDNLFSVRWYERLTRRYVVLCNVRGVHKFGPTVLHSGDVFGFLRNEQTLENLEYLLVYPLVVPLTRLNLPSRHPFGERRAPRRLLEDPAQVIGVRDYVYEDSLRRVHWKASARAMRLQSKIYAATTTYTLAIFLNVPAQFDSLHGIQSEIQELAICAAASVSDWALNEGYAVGLYANTLMFMPEEQVHFEEQDLAATLAVQVKRRRIHLPPATSEEQRKNIMDALARVQPYFGSSFEDLVRAERSHLPAGATVVIISGAVTDPLLDILTRVQAAGHAVTILFVGDKPSPHKLAGTTVFHLGGSETWQQLAAAYGRKDAAAEQSEAAPGLGL